MKIKRIILPLLGIALLAGCKPTEKNYQKAYDKAHEAAERKAAEEKVSLSDLIETEHMGRFEIIGKDSVLVLNELTKPYGTTLTPDGRKHGVAIAKFKMPGNAKRNVSDISGDYPEAFVATDGRENYFVVINRVAPLEETAECIKGFRLTHPDYPYIGLWGSPVVIVVREE